MSTMNKSPDRSLRVEYSFTVNQFYSWKKLIIKKKTNIHIPTKHSYPLHATSHFVLVLCCTETENNSNDNRPARRAYIHGSESSISFLPTQNPCAVIALYFSWRVRKFFYSFEHLLLCSYSSCILKRASIDSTGEVQDDFGSILWNPRVHWRDPWC